MLALARRPDSYARKAGAYRRGPKASAVALRCGIPLDELGHGGGVEGRNRLARLVHIDEVEFVAAAHHTNLGLNRG
jgi:hypothetical protein